MTDLIMVDSNISPNADWNDLMSFQAPYATDYSLGADLGFSHMQQPDQEPTWMQVTMNDSSPSSLTPLNSPDPQVSGKDSSESSLNRNQVLISTLDFFAIVKDIKKQLSDLQAHFEETDKKLATVAHNHSTLLPWTIEMNKAIGIIARHVVDTLGGKIREGGKWQSDLDVNTT